MKLERLGFYGLAVLIVFLLLAMLFPVHRGGGPAKILRARMEETSLFVGMTNYKAMFGNYPTGENSNIVKVLAGDNPPIIVLLNFSRYVEHPNEMIDPWKTPYQIEFLNGTNFIIRSAGKDKIFGDKDDFVFSSIANDFVKP